MKKAWETWPSKNRFYCNGLFLSGPDRYYFYGACALIFIPSALFFGFLGEFMLFYIHPILFVIPVVLLIFGAVSLLATGFMDPGILPRQPDVKEAEDNPFAKPPPTRTVTVKTFRMKLKYCDTCNLYRPPRSSHCSICDNCVDRFDHHCPWVGNCVGRRNYHFFLSFVFSVWFLGLYVAVIGILYLVLKSLDSDEDGIFAFLDTLKHNPVSLILAVYGLIIWGTLATLCGFHSFLICVNQTTNEQLKGLYKKKRNPHFKGWCFNWILMFFPIHRPSCINPRAVVGGTSGSPTKKGGKGGGPQEVEMQPV